GASLAVVLDEAPLVHTGQLWPAPRERGGAGQHLAALLDRLDRDLASVQPGLHLVVNPNVYLARAADLGAVNAAPAKRVCGKAPEIRKVIEEFYGKEKSPPLVLLEWQEKDSVEIELVASAPVVREKAKGAIDFLTPPNMTTSSVFSRVTRVNHGRRIYTSGI